MDCPSCGAASTAERCTNCGFQLAPVTAPAAGPSLPPASTPSPPTLRSPPNVGPTASQSAAPPSYVGAILNATPLAAGLAAPSQQDVNQAAEAFMSEIVLSLLGNQGMTKTMRDQILASKPLSPGAKDILDNLSKMFSPGANTPGPK